MSDSSNPQTLHEERVAGSEEFAADRALWRAEMGSDGALEAAGRRPPGCRGCASPHVPLGVAGGASASACPTTSSCSRNSSGTTGPIGSSRPASHVAAA